MPSAGEKLGRKGERERESTRVAGTFDGIMLEEVAVSSNCDVECG